MSIDEAIKTLEHNDDTYQVYTMTIRNKAIKLGIEALKSIKLIRQYDDPGYSALLPGETKD